MAWTPKILTEFELGLASAAIDDVTRLDKPLAEVGSRVGSCEDIEHDLRQCLSHRAGHEQISIWIRQRGDRWAFGFYRAPWVIRAMDYLEQTTLEPIDRHWISGLLFGYRASAIQQFIDEVAANPDPAVDRTANSRPSHSSSTPGTSRLREIRRALGS